MAAAHELFRRLPRMDDLLDDPELQQWAEGAGLSRQLVRTAATRLLADLRARIGAGELSLVELERELADPTAAVRGAVAAMTRPVLRRVVNGTGVVVHTNLGRSPWPASAAARVAELATAYTNLEFDLEDGARGVRERPVGRFFEELLPGYAVAVVNNNAAAVLLTLNTFAQGREVIVSRGQLVEIGGSFRIPDVMEKGFCRLREVGTTNRTRERDYRQAIGPQTGLLLAVHPSNYRVVGFTESTPLEQLVALGGEHSIPVAEDLGSGNLVGVAGVDEPTVAERLETGVDVVTFSGDKLLGGPQAGFIAGRPEAVQRCRDNPLYRALRLDKAALLGIEATLGEVLAGRIDAVPTLRMLRRGDEALRDDAEQLAARVHRAAPACDPEAVRLQSRVGGGAAPGVDLPSWGVAVDVAGVGADELARRLRRASPAVLGRIIDDRLVFDVRTLLEGDAERLVTALLGATSPAGATVPESAPPD